MPSRTRLLPNTLRASANHLRRTDTCQLSCQLWCAQPWCRDPNGQRHGYSLIRVASVPPLLSQKLADSLSLGRPLVGGATQADGVLLPLRDVGSVDIIGNGLPVSQNFLSAPLSHYDVILSEPWLKENEILMDYAYNALRKCSDDGLLSPISFGSAVQTDTGTPSPSLAAIDAQHKHTERAVKIDLIIARKEIM